MNINKESWAKALRTTFVCLCILTIALAFAEILGLFYLYSFDRGPKRWTNVIEFYARPKEISAGRAAPESDPLASLIVRGNTGALAYARRRELSLADIKPSALHDCLLAAEDKRFYRHSGMNYFGVAMALWDHFVDGDRLRGASTISNQLIRTVILADRSRSLWRKIPEILLTDAAERHFSKDDLLLAYVNNVPVGHLDGRALIGFGAASEAFFGKRDPRTLTLSEACTLAGMLNRPNGYLRDALKGNYRSIINRRNIVLENLRSSNPERYSKAAIEWTKREKIRFFKHGRKYPSEPRHLVPYAYQQLPYKKAGMQVYLTVDPTLQRAAEAAVKEELDDFDRGPYGFYNRLSYEHAAKEGRKISQEDAKLQAALVALDPKTGEILAMVGGKRKSEFNRAIQAKRAPGSLIKPFVYLYGIKSGYINGRPFRADTIIDPSIRAVAQRYTTGGAARATVQLARSDNGAAVAVMHEFGISRVTDFVGKITGTKPSPNELIAIGAGKGIEMSPLQLGVAFTIFPNGGMRSVPTPIAAVHDGEKKFDMPVKKSVRVTDADSASSVARMLQSVIGDGPDGNHGTARMARQISGLDAKFPLAGKTGTGDNDLWFVGFTPRLVVVVWVGFDNNYPRFEMDKGFAGSGLPLQIWGRFMRDVKRYRPEW